VTEPAHDWIEGRRSSEERYGCEITVKQRWRCRRCGIRAQYVVTAPKGGPGSTSRWRWKRAKKDEWEFGTPEGADVACVEVAVVRPS